LWVHQLTTQLPRLQPLRVFEAAGRLGSFTAAARELGLTQPAVTQQIRALEVAIDVQLFDRSANRATLNSAGSALLVAVSTAFDGLARSIDELRLGRPTFVLAVNPGIAQRWLVPHLADLQAQLETVDVRLWLFDRDSELRQNHFDAAIHLTSKVPDGVRSVPLFEEAVSPIASPTFADEHGLTPDSPPTDLPPDRLLHLDPTDRTWMQWTDWFAGMSVSPPRSRPQVLYNNYALLLQEVIAGRGIGLGWRYLIDDQIASGAIVQVGPEVSRRTSDYRLLWPATTHPSAIDAIVNFFDSQL
jgi:LysR family glycine cleavage system transcriptional activator